jgi:L-asparagine transporter-like permease
MKGDKSKSKNFNQSFWLIMGFVWISFALFGLIFDPEKRVIIISQIAAGILFFVIFIVIKLKNTKKDIKED